MPHIIVKLWPGKSEPQKRRLAAQQCHRQWIRRTARNPRRGGEL